MYICLSVLEAIVGATVKLFFVVVQLAAVAADMFIFAK